MNKISKCIFIHLLIVFLVHAIAVTAQTSVKFNWAKHTTGSLNEYIQSVQVDNAGNIYACGYFSGNVDFDPGTSVYMMNAQGLNDAFILKLAPNGGFVWARQLSGPNDDVAYSCTIDNVNNQVIFAGYFSDSIDLNPGSGINKQYSIGSTDLYIVALDFNANYLNALHLGGSGDDAVNGISIDHAQNILATGYFQNTMNYGGTAPNYKSLISTGGDDVFVLKWNASSFQATWALAVGAMGQQDGNTIGADSKNNIRIAGYF